MPAKTVFLPEQARAMTDRAEANLPSHLQFAQPAPEGPPTEEPPPEEPATGFFGSVLRQTIEFPRKGNVTSTADYRVDDDVEFSNGFYSVDVTSNQIILQVDGSGNASPGDFNGTHFFDVYGSIPDITSVTIEDENIAGFDASDVSFDANNIWINLASVSLTPSSHIILNVDFA